MLTESEENYLKTIFKIAEREKNLSQRQLSLHI